MITNSSSYVQSLSFIPLGEPGAAGASSAAQDTEQSFGSLSSLPLPATLQPAGTSPDTASQGTSDMELCAATHASNVHQPSKYLVEKAEEGGTQWDERSCCTSADLVQGWELNSHPITGSGASPSRLPPCETSKK